MVQVDQDIHNRLLQKDSALSLQVDVTATPRHNNGAIFVQTVCRLSAGGGDFAERGQASRAARRGQPGEAGGAAERQVHREIRRLLAPGRDRVAQGLCRAREDGKKAILFVMTDDTQNCDDVAAYLEGNYPDLKGAVLVIHTKNNGEISEATSGKSKEELEELRKQANEIDSMDSPYKAIVSVMMLKEGWDVRNVTTIVGLRAYSSKSNILPEQTLGRGLRKMYPGGVHGIRQRGRHRRLHGFRGIDPGRRRGAGTQADGRRDGAEDAAGGRGGQGERRKRTSTRWTSRFP